MHAGDLRSAPSPRWGEGWGEGLGASIVQFPLTRLASLADLSPQGRGEAERVSEIHLVAALEHQDFARLIGRRDLEAEALDDLTRLGDLLRVRLRELAGPDPERVFQAHAHVAAHRGRLRG